MNICEIRKEGESFISDIGRFYLFGGNQPGTTTNNNNTLKEIYQKNEQIFTKKNIEFLKREYEKNPIRQSKFLISFLIQGYIGIKMYPLTEDIVKKEISTSVQINNTSVSLRYGMLLLPSENDRIKRIQLDEYLGKKQSELNPLREKRMVILKEIAEELGYKDYLQLIEDTTCVNLEQIKQMASKILQGTNEEYSLLRNRLKDTFLGVGDKCLTKTDISYIFKTNSFDKYFPEIEMVPTVEDTLFGLGINIHKQVNITPYFEKKDKKDPKSFCCPIKIPEELYLSFNPKGGIEDYQSSLHETGHCQYYAHMNKGLPFEFKRLGDKAIGEGYGFLLQFLTNNPSWIEKFLDIPKDRQNSYQVFINGYQLYILRRFCGKLLYELEVFSKENDAEVLQEKYVTIMEEAVKIKVNPQNFLLDLDLGFSTPQYIKAWIYEGYLRDYLQNNFGMDWFTNKKSGDKLISLWENGQALTCEEIIKQLGYNEFNEDILIKQFHSINTSIKTVKNNYQNL